jgi:5-methylcytosine-specific restriction enzyme subunit McrC
MNTDTSLLSDDRVIIIECKWTAETLQRGKLRSDHLYQLSAYMRHHRHSGSPASVEGLLLYPLIDKPVDVVVRVGQQKLRVCTIDFTTDWSGVHRQLCELLEDPSSSLMSQTAVARPEYQAPGEGSIVANQTGVVHCRQ